MLKVCTYVIPSLIYTMQASAEAALASINQANYFPPQLFLRVLKETPVSLLKNDKELC